MKASARYFIDQHDLANVFQIHIPWGITDKTVGSVMSSQRFYVSFEPVIQEAMREALQDRDLDRPHIIFSRPCPASMERPNWTIAFIL
jgi:L-rhamnose isomerase